MCPFLPFHQAVDDTVIPAAVKSALRDRVSALTKTLLEAQKKAAAGNKERAGKEAVTAAQAAQANGDKFLVLQVEVRNNPSPWLARLWQGNRQRQNICGPHRQAGNVCRGHDVAGIADCCKLVLTSSVYVGADSQHVLRRWVWTQGR